MQALRGTLATRGILIIIGALIAIAASAVTAVAVRAGAAGSTQTSVGAGGVAGPRDTVTVVGEGTQNATPDNALISMGVLTRQSTAADAMNAANSEMTALLKAIKGQGVLDADIQTTGINVYQENQYNVIGYRAGNTVNVKIHHIANIGTVLGAAQGAVGNDIQINGITLQLSDNTNQLKGARQGAMNAAADRAKEWANLAGRHLGKVLSVSEVIGGSSGYSPCGAGGQCGGGGGGAPVQAGQMNVTVDVAVVYELND
ncbi:MAG TPA: SIMPL domain-containing protein [Candidatus Acidoferrum sp.]|nr:SIMPL domain-containing protein [Candidatus Acidoferrum sp.]